jgi:hypothetical protein
LAINGSINIVFHGNVIPYIYIYVWKKEKQENNKKNKQTIHEKEIHTNTI